MRMLCPKSVVETTLTNLRETGRSHRECVMLWLGRREGEQVRVIDAYRPLQTSKADMFHINGAGMAALHQELRRQRVMVAAQVHSHPMEAFHSKADDDWAIVRHEGALSLVVPHFASGTSLSNFFAQTKVYRFSATAHWIEVPQSEVQNTCLQIV
jgi:proteasome lid subunit RPN8/RPN11